MGVCEQLARGWFAFVLDPWHYMNTWMPHVYCVTIRRRSSSRIQDTDRLNSYLFGKQGTPVGNWGAYMLKFRAGRGSPIQVWLYLFLSPIRAGGKVHIEQTHPIICFTYSFVWDSLRNVGQCRCVFVILCIFSMVCTLIFARLHMHSTWSKSRTERCCQCFQNLKTDYWTSELALGNLISSFNPLKWGGQSLVHTNTCVDKYFSLPLLTQIIFPQRFQYVWQGLISSLSKPMLDAAHVCCCASGLQT